MLVITFVVSVGTGQVVIARLGMMTEPAREAALLQLLADVDVAEQAMLGFNAAVSSLLPGGIDRDDVRDAELLGVAAAAAEAMAQLDAPRRRIVAQRGDRALDEVRAAYLPHLDAWVEHLELLSDTPEAMLDGDLLQPSILLISATAVVFKEALEQLIVEAPWPEVIGSAERILDQGFRSVGPEATL
jgi:hypothetical protein